MSAIPASAEKKALMKKAFATTKKAEAVEVAALPRRLRNVARAEKRKEKTQKRGGRQKELCAFRSHTNEEEEEEWCENHNVDSRYRVDRQKRDENDDGWFDCVSDWGDYDWFNCDSDDYEDSHDYVRDYNTHWDYLCAIEKRIYDCYGW